MNLIVNDIIAYAENGHMHRILWISETGVAHIDISSENAMPCLERRSLIEQLIEQGGVAISKTKYVKNIQEESLSIEARKIRDKRWEIIQDIVHQEPDIYIAGRRGPLIVNVLKKHKISKPTLYLSLRRYWQRGKNPNALLPDFDKCGGRGKEKIVGEKKMGRPRIYTDAEGINIDESHKSLIRMALKLYYFNEAELSLRDAYNKMISKFYNEGIHIDSSGRELPVIPSDANYPTFRQFRYWYEKERDIRHAIESRRGKIAYAKDFRPVLGSSTAEVYGPGSRFQIDATIADVYLVSRLDPNKIIGRPVLYLVMDVFSRMIVGLYVGLEGPSWVTAMMALANAASDKVEYCKQYGITIHEEDWPSHYLPNAIIGDRGEMLCSALDNLINNYGVKVENTPPYRPDWKGIVEQHFRTVQRKFRPYTPGYVKKDFQQRGAKDYRLEATLNIDDFTQMMIQIVLHHNNANELSKYDPHEFLIPEEVAPIPVELWNWGIVNRSGRLKAHDSTEIRLSLLPRDNASVTPFGIEFRCCYYGCDSALKERWFEKARNSGRWKITVSYDPRSMDTIYLNNDIERRFEACQLLERSRQFENQSLWEIEEALFSQNKSKAERSHKHLQSIVALDHALDTIKNNAISRKKESEVELTKSERVRNIRPNRAIERDIQRNKESFVLPREKVDDSIVLPFSAGSDDELGSNNDLELLRANRDKRWSDDEKTDDE